MPEGSGLGGENAEVRIVWTSLRCTTGAAEAEAAGQSSVPDAATKTAHTKRRMPADDACRASLGDTTPGSPVPLMPQKIRLAGRVCATEGRRLPGAQGRGELAALLGGIKVADERLDPFELLRYGGHHHVQALPRLL